MTNPIEPAADPIDDLVESTQKDVSTGELLSGPSQSELGVDFLEAASEQSVEFSGSNQESDLQNFFETLSEEAAPRPEAPALPEPAPAPKLVWEKPPVAAVPSSSSSAPPTNLKTFWGDEPLPKGAPKISAVLTLNPEVKVAASKAPSLNELAKTDLSKLENADALLDPTPRTVVEPDFSLWQAAETGEAFPTTKQLKQAITLIMLTGFIGFGVGYTLFVKRQIAINVPKVDRQAAEKPPPLAYRSESGSNLIFSNYGGATQAPEVEEKGPDLTLKAPQMGNKPIATAPTPSPTPKVLAVKSEEDNANYPGRNGPQPHVAHTKPGVPVIQSPGSSRPDVKGWVQAWNEGKQACITFNSFDGPVLGGVIVRADGTALTCLSRLNPDSLSRVVTSRGVVSGRILQRDTEHDIALVQLSGADFPYMPLSPDAPSAGAWMLTPNAYDPQRNWQQQVTSVLTGGALRIRGSVSNLSAGWPLINDRAEVVGVSIGRPFLFDANLSVAIGSSSLVGLLDGRAATGFHRTCNEVFEEMFKGLPSIASRARPTTANNKAVPGEAMGNYPLGMTRQQLTSELGAPGQQDGSGALARLTFPTHHLVAFLVHDQVVAFETDNTFYAYGRGISPGGNIDIAKFQSEFPGAVFNETGGRGVGLAVGFEVESQNGKITKIRVVAK